jgi:hypothetical protein
MRERPRTYALTIKGLQLAMTLQKIHNLMTEAQLAAAQLIKHEETTQQQHVEDGKKTVAQLPTIQYARPN